MSKLPIKTEDSMFTDQQWEAIHTTGTNLLISASAGSGKTMVLVNRIIEQIKNGISIDELLVVTFTNAAAKEMKQRIQTALQKEITSDPDPTTRHHLVQQIPKLGHANISTLHSFCLQVIERYYYLIDFDPVFRQLTDDTEIELIKEEVWDELLEELYETDDKDFIRFMEAYSGSRNDEPVTEMVFQLHEFSRANEYPTKWLESLVDLYDIPSGKLEDSTIYKRYMKKQLIEEANYLIQMIDQALDLANHEESLEKQIAVFNQDKSHYRKVVELLENDQLDECYQLVNNGFTFPRLNAPSKKTTPEEVLEVYRNEIKPLRDEAKKDYNKFKEHFALTSKQQVDIITATKKHVEVLARVTEQFSKDYQQYKADRKLVDFNDLEHLTLQILRGEVEGETSEASTYYRDKFEEVLVDEYQDINALQEAILLLLANEKDDIGNYFMVGDVKQSIYGFRLADPGLFLSKYEEYSAQESGQRIILAENFRSRKNVLSFTNFIFTQLMDREVGNLDYDKDAELVYGNKDFEEDSKYATELLVYEKGKEEKSSREWSEENLSNELDISTKTTGEILMTATRIRELVDDGFEIYDKEKERMRPVEYRDIVLLTPTKNNNLEIQEIFQEVGIPSAINETQNFFQTTEVTIMMSLLKIIDNPQQDIPLVAVLRSPIVGLDEIELTYIRLQDKQANFYEATLAFAEAEFEDPKNISLQKKVRAFLNSLNKWRYYARRHTVVELLRLLYRETNYIHYVGGMSGGKQRRANLEALYERAAAYENTSFKGLYRFIRFIDKMQEKDKDLAEPTSILSEQNAVRVMTIHASKGLEFPIVFLMDMSKQFNNSDWTGTYIFDRELGVGLEYKNPDEFVKASTIVGEAIKMHKKQNGYAEQMRLLYVALTRAEQKLFLVGSMESQEKAFDRWNKANSRRDYLLSPRLRLNTNNFMDWIGFAIARHQTTEHEVSSIQGNKQIKHYPVDFCYRFYSEDKIATQLQDISVGEEPAWVEELKENKIRLNIGPDATQTINKAMNIINYEYPYQLSTVTTNYQSVSEIKQLFEEPNSEKVAKIDWSNEEGVHRYTSDLLERPRFLQEETKPTPAEIGQATHFLLQNMDLSEEVTIDRIQKEVQRMLAEGVLKEESAKRVDTEKIYAYFQTSFGQEIIQHHDSLEKEVLFSLMMDADEVFTGIESVEDSILIHGIIDGYFERENGLVLFDYKTDQVAHLGDQAEEELLRRYTGQVMLYKQALETITEKPVVEVNIISLDLTKTIPVHK
ncbi:MAG TPA: helicase-exonuclease AddAB subunit AddA [Atopostipes sp.]|nr:helicase-exonuclease AddAB subunit AddA [Atopostipes sp.]